ncbi:MAG TPA: acyl--CoA ligase [Thermoanaerobaculia bacterium]|nr:acyl--CoA ligase [Thermoanaerobaculia bacterium]
MGVSRTIDELLTRGAADRPAIAASGRPALDHAGLRRQVAAAGEALGGLGVGPGDVVALVLPNGPEAATAFLAVASHAAAAPLNPAYTEAELAFYLDDLEASLVVVAPGEGGAAARRVAGERGIALVELVVPDGAPAGVLDLRRAGDGESGRVDAMPGKGPAGRPRDRSRSDRPRDLALVLHTSGTTSRPKMVALTQANLCASAANVAASLALGPDDRCLNVMPLFHIHGLVAAVLASLAAGGSVFCAPGWNALRFFAWLEESRATWYTAVPTIHQAVLDRAPRNAEILERSGLRLVRSSSAALPPQVMARLEQVFRAPVIEAYGMTEAAHQMASNPLPPRRREPGSVGIAAGPEIAVMDAGGRLLEPGEIGEVVIRGPSVTAGYLGDSEATAAAFTDGWLRTGDQGWLDGEGYLRLTGRLKEIINRGGEKISPREVDEALLDHPAVAQAVTFALPDARLGEEVAAAVVLRDGAAATESEIRDFARARLAAFKVPRRVLFLAEIPKGATGKLQRIGLAEKLGLG